MRKDRIRDAIFKQNEVNASPKRISREPSLKKLSTSRASHESLTDVRAGLTTDQNGAPLEIKKVANFRRIVVDTGVMINEEPSEVITSREDIAVIINRAGTVKGPDNPIVEQREKAVNFEETEQPDSKLLLSRGSMRRSTVNGNFASVLNKGASEIDEKSHMGKSSRFQSRQDVDRSMLSSRTSGFTTRQSNRRVEEKTLTI